MSFIDFPGKNITILINDGCGEVGYEDFTSYNLETTNFALTLSKNMKTVYDWIELELAIILTGNFRDVPY